MCYGLNICFPWLEPPPRKKKKKNPNGILMPIEMVLAGGAFIRWSDGEGRAPRKGISTL